MSSPRCPRNDACWRANHPQATAEPPADWCDYAKAHEVELCPAKGESDATV